MIESIRTSALIGALVLLLSPAILDATPAHADRKLAVADTMTVVAFDAETSTVTLRDAAGLVHHFATNEKTEVFRGGEAASLGVLNSGDRVVVESTSIAGGAVQHADRLTIVIDPPASDPKR